MTKCWAYRPEERPTFRYCLEELLDLKNNCETMELNVHNLSGQAINGKFKSYKFSYLINRSTHKSNRVHIIS